MNRRGLLKALVAAPLAAVAAPIMVKATPRKLKNSSLSEPGALVVHPTTVDALVLNPATVTWTTSAAPTNYVAYFQILYD